MPAPQSLTDLMLYFAPMSQIPQLIYLGRVRIHRSRANLIQTLHTVEAFEQLGVRTTLYLPPWRRNFDATQWIHAMGIDRPLDVRPSQLLHPRWHFWPFVLRHRRRLREADQVYTRVPEISLALASADIPHHLEVHETDPIITRRQMDRLVQYHQQGLLRCIVTTTRVDADVLIHAGAHPDRTLVGPNGVDVEAFSDVSPFDPHALDRPRIVYIGKVTRNRGLPIFHALARTGRYDITLVGDQEDHAPAAVHLVPFVPHREVPQWYGRADLALMPYQPDLYHAKSICPIKLFEAMAAGRPIIVSNLKPIAEFVEHEKTALLVEPTDAQAWIDAVERLRTDRDLAVTLARNAKVQSAQHSWLNRAKRIAEKIGLLPLNT